VCHLYRRLGFIALIHSRSVLAQGGTRQRTRYLRYLRHLVPRRGEVLGEGPPKVPGVTVATPTGWQTVLLREYMNDTLF
jgi:hypothetical protein